LPSGITKYYEIEKKGRLEKNFDKKSKPEKSDPANRSSVTRLQPSAGLAYRTMAKDDLTGIGELQALLGRGTKFRGKLTFEGRIRIDGEFSGEVFSDDVLILGENAEVRAEIEVGTLIVRGGSLWGNVRANQLVEIYAPSRVFGDIQTSQIFLDKGVIFEGNCTMLEKETADESKGEEDETR
jgi:cytoskeletal protein CcmA (bactofilin family)